MKLRFAPSPTGNLHLGNLRIAIINWLYAKKNNAEFLLRLDDTDTERSTDEFKNNIKNDLATLNINYDKCFEQSQNISLYDDAIEKLKKSGRVYECFETPDELELKRKLQLNSGKPPVYDRAGLKLSQEEKQKFIDEGRTPHYRFLLENEDIEFCDIIKGDVKFTPGHLSDPVLIRADGRYLYTLSSVVDDGNEKITHIFRGEDHITNTAVQIQLFKALGYDIPIFGHLPMIANMDGKNLSKRDGATGVSDFILQNVLPSTIVIFIAKMGSSDAIVGTENMQSLINDFDIKKYSKSTTKYSFDMVKDANEKIIHNLNFCDLKTHINHNIDENIWNIIRSNVNDLSEIEDYEKIINGSINIDGISVDNEYKKVALECFDFDTIDEKTWKIWTGKISDNNGLKGKNLFLPLRLILTGKQNGPEMSKLLPYINFEVIKQRLN